MSGSRSGLDIQVALGTYAPRVRKKTFVPDLLKMHTLWSIDSQEN